MTPQLKLWYLLALWKVIFDQPALAVLSTPGSPSLSTSSGSGSSSRSIKQFIINQMAIYEEKVHVQAELSLLTTSLGFCNCDTYQGPEMLKLLHEYLRMKRGHEIINKVMKAETFARVTPEHRLDFCNQFLTEPVLAENFIFLDEAEASYIDIVPKRLRYEYYTKNDDEVDALRCPVIIHNEKTMLYISGFGSHTNWNMEPYPQYFLFQDHPYQPDTITILMRTMAHPHLQKCDRPVPGSRPRPTKLNSISNSRISEHYRLMAMDAERAYITWRFGFINYSSSPYAIDQLIKYVEVLKIGYELEWPDGTNSSLTEEEMNHFCDQAIRMSSSTFAQRHMYIQADRDAKADMKMISQKVVFQRLRVHPQSYDVLQCPIIINGSVRIEWQVYMKLLRYKKLSRCPPHGIVLINLPFDSRAATVLSLSKIDIFMHTDAMVEHLHQAEERQNTDGLALVPEREIPIDKSENASEKVHEAMKESRVGVRHPLMVRMDKHAVVVESKSSSQSESEDIGDLNVNNPTMDSEKKGTGDESESTDESTSDEDIQNISANSLLISEKRNAGDELKDTNPEKYENTLISEKRRAGDESNDTNPEEHEGDMKHNRPPSVTQTEESNHEWENSNKSTEEDFRYVNANSLAMFREKKDISNESQYRNAVESFSSASEDTDFHDSSFDNPSITQHKDRGSGELKRNNCNNHNTNFKNTKFNSPPSMMETSSEESQSNSLDDVFSSAQSLITAR